MNAQVKFPEFIDSTTRASFVSCPRKFYYEHVLHRAKPGQRIDLTAGGAIARGLEVTRKAFHQERLGKNLALGRGAAALIKHYCDEIPLEEQDTEHTKNLYRCLEAFEGYFDEFGWKSDHIQPYNHGGVYAIENNFALPLEINHPETGNPMIYTGRFDMIGVFRDQLWAVDEKTTKQLGPSWLSNWTMRGQLTAYAYAAKQFGVPVVGALIRGICFTKDIKYGQALEYRHTWELDRWWEQLHHDVKRMIQCWESGYWDYALENACTTFGGCQFVPVCNSLQPERVLNLEYAERIWNPLANDA